MEPRSVIWRFVLTRLDELTTLRLGGPIRRIEHAKTACELIDAVRSADAAGEPVLIVGGGSNLVAADAGWDGVVVLVDARHPLMPLDRQLIGWLGDTRRKLVLLTKADKLSRVQQQKALQDVCKELPRDEVLLFSSVSKYGLEECRDLLERWLAAGRENKRPPVKGI